jgi:hypothetical protein
MIPLTRWTAVLYEHTRLARLEIDASLHAAIGTAVDRRIVPVVHGNRNALPNRFTCSPTWRDLNLCRHFGNSKER